MIIFVLIFFHTVDEKYVFRDSLLDSNLKPSEGKLNASRIFIMIFDKPQLVLTTAATTLRPVNNHIIFCIDALLYIMKKKFNQRK